MQTSDIHALLAFHDDGTLTAEQTINAIKIDSSYAERSEDSKRLGRVIDKVAAGELPPAVLKPVWSLTTDPPSGTVVTTLHATEADVITSLRENSDDEGEYDDIPDDEIVQKLIDSDGLSIYIEQHDLSYLIPREA